MSFQTLVPLAGSKKAAPANAKALPGNLNAQDKVNITIVLKRKSKDDLSAHNFAAILERALFSDTHGADPADISRVEAFANLHQLAVVDSSVSKRRVILSGTVASMRAAFQTELECYQNEATGHTFRGRTGTLSIPQDLEGAVVAVLGLDDRPVAKPHFRCGKKKDQDPATFTPVQVAQLYGFPTSVNGTGQTIAIIELGGGFAPADLATYFQDLKISPAPNVTAISVDGATNKTGSQADGEVMLDIEVAGAIAPGANIAVYFTTNTDKGFIDAITDAVHDATRKPSVVSISWGGPEDSWTAQSKTALDAALQDAAALGVTVTVASGDNGSTDGETDGNLHVDFPASSPYALACGGTKLTASGTSIASEVVWNETANKEGATGGGISSFFPLPTYQASAGVPVLPGASTQGRGVPDVAGDADPSTGYVVLVDGKLQVVGGTSAVAPLWAALVALLNQQLGKNLGFLNPTLYSIGESAFNDITSGNNDDGNLGNYSAKTGWDPCTGLGSPNAAALLSALSSAASAKSGK